MKISIANELVQRHSDQEIIEFLSRTTRGLVQNYKVAVEKGDSSILFANLGDLTMVASVLAELDKREKNKLATQENM